MNGGIGGIEKGSGHSLLTVFVLLLDLTGVCVSNSVVKI